MSKADIGLIGLAVMGENLILNMESKGFTVACYNRTVSKVDDFINGRAKGKNIIGCKSIEQLVASLSMPRARANSTSAQVSPAAKKERLEAHQLCRAAHHRRGNTSNLFFRPSVLKPRMGSPAATGSAKMEPDTSSR